MQLGMAPPKPLSRDQEGKPFLMVTRKFKYTHRLLLRIETLILASCADPNSKKPLRQPGARAFYPGVSVLDQLRTLTNTCSKNLVNRRTMCFLLAVLHSTCHCAAPETAFSMETSFWANDINIIDVVCIISSLLNH
jgi:hypothetical protein